RRNHAYANCLSTDQRSCRHPTHTFPRDGTGNRPGDARTCRNRFGNGQRRQWAADRGHAHPHSSSETETVAFRAMARVDAREGAHTVRVTTTNDSNFSVTQTITVLVASSSCVYPQSNP